MCLRRLVGGGLGIIFLRMVEPGLVTLLKIVGVLALSIGTIPLLLLLSPGAERGEPQDLLDTPPQD